MKPKLSSKAQQLPLDRISTLPQPIIETILCLVPIKDAVRTSILSTNWRYNWTTITKLVFNERYMFDKSNDEHQLEQSPNETKKLTSKSSKLFSAIHQVLSLHQGPILEFSFTMNTTDNTCNEIDQIITYLSRNNTVKKFTLILVPHRKYSLPSSFYTLHHLTDLHLHNCDFYPKPTFKGFPNLTSLHVTTEHLSVKSIAHLLSLSPLLKSFTLMLSNGGYLERNAPMFEIFKYLAVIEHLSLHMCLFRGICEEEEEEEAPQELPSALVHLKYLCLCEMFCAESGLPFLVVLIRSSPNLEKIKLQMHTYRHLHSNRLQGTRLVTPPGYLNIWLEHLNELEIEKFFDDECEIEFVMLILVKSPVLKKVNIVLNDFVLRFNVEGLKKVSKILLRSPRASPVAEINVEHPPKVEKQG